MFYYISICVISLLCLFFVGATLYRKGMFWALKVSILLFAFGIAFWQISLIVIGGINDLDIFHRIAFSSSSWALIGGYGISLYYPNRLASSKENTLFAFFASANLFFSISLFFTNIIISGYDINLKHVKFGQAGNIFLAFILIILSTFVIRFINRYRKEKVERFYLRYVFISFGLYGALALLLNLVFPLLEIKEFTLFGAIFAFLPLSVIVYTLVSDRLYRIRYLLGMAFYILIRASFYHGLFYLFVIFYLNLWGDVLVKQGIIVGFLFAIIVALILIVLERKLNNLFEDKILYGEYSPIRLRDELFDLTAIELDVDTLVGKFLRLIKNALGSNNVGIVFFSEEKKSTVYYLDNSFNKDLDKSKSLFYELKTLFEINPNLKYLNKYVLESKIINEPMLGRRFDDLNVSVVFPITYRAGLRGLYVLGSKIYPEPYTQNDFSKMENFVTFGASAFERAQLYAQVVTFNVTLQTKIAKATEELQQKYAELKQIRDKERDMIDIMGHELRTPLSIVKVSLSALDLKAQKDPVKFDYQTYKEYLPRITDALERESQLLETMISSTKIDAKRMEVHPEEVNLVSIIEDSIIGQKELVLQKGLKVKFSRPEREIKVFADKVRLGEVLDNLIGNAVKYTQKGYVAIRIDNEDKFIRVSVQDTGPGIPDESLPRLGEKFFRVKQHLNEGESDVQVVRPGGTGLGLYVSFGLVELMGGKVTVESKVGEGSTFSFTVPKYSGQKVDVKTADSKDIFTRLGLKEGQS